MFIILKNPTFPKLNVTVMWGHMTCLSCWLCRLSCGWWTAGSCTVSGPAMNLRHHNRNHFGVHCKKRLAAFPSPAGMSPTINYSLPGRVWLVTSRPGMGKPLTFFYSVPHCNLWVTLASRGSPSVTKPRPGIKSLVCFMAPRVRGFRENRHSCTVRYILWLKISPPPQLVSAEACKTRPCQ